MTGIIESIASAVMGIVSSLGAFGVLLGMLIESCCIPLPSELILPVAGNLVAQGHLMLLWANIAALVGSVIGSLTAYYIGYYGGRPLVIRMITKYGKYFLVEKHHFEKAELSFLKYGPATVLVGRVLPIIRTFISLPAGVAKMNVWKFLVYSMIGILPWNFLLIWLGYTLGSKYKTVISPILHRFDYVVIAAVVLFCGYIVYKVTTRYRKAKREEIKND